MNRIIAAFLIFLVSVSFAEDPVNDPVLTHLLTSLNMAQDDEKKGTAAYRELLAYSLDHPDSFLQFSARYLRTYKFDYPPRDPKTTRVKKFGPASTQSTIEELYQLTMERSPELIRPGLERALSSADPAVVLDGAFILRSRNDAVLLSLAEKFNKALGRLDPAMRTDALRQIEGRVTKELPGVLAAAITENMQSVGVSAGSERPGLSLLKRLNDDKLETFPFVVAVLQDKLQLKGEPPHLDTNDKVSVAILAHLPNYPLPLKDLKSRIDESPLSPEKRKDFLGAICIRAAQSRSLSFDDLSLISSWSRSGKISKDKFTLFLRLLDSKTASPLSLEARELYLKLVQEVEAGTGEILLSRFAKSPPVAEASAYQFSSSEEKAIFNGNQWKSATVEPFCRAVCEVKLLRNPYGSEDFIRGNFNGGAANNEQLLVDLRVSFEMRTEHICGAASNEALVSKSLFTKSEPRFVNLYRATSQPSKTKADILAIEFDDHRSPALYYGDAFALDSLRAVRNWTGLPAARDGELATLADERAHRLANVLRLPEPSPTTRSFPVHLLATGYLALIRDGSIDDKTRTTIRDRLLATIDPKRPLVQAYDISPYRHPIDEENECSSVARTMATRLALFEDKQYAVPPNDKRDRLWEAVKNYDKYLDSLRRSATGFSTYDHRICRIAPPFFAVSADQAAQAIRVLSGDAKFMKNHGEQIEAIRSNLKQAVLSLFEKGRFKTWYETPEGNTKGEQALANHFYGTALYDLLTDSERKACLAYPPPGTPPAGQTPLDHQ